MGKGNLFSALGEHVDLLLPQSSLRPVLRQHRHLRSCPHLHLSLRQSRRGVRVGRGWRNFYLHRSDLSSTLQIDIGRHRIQPPDRLGVVAYRWCPMVGVASTTHKEFFVRSRAGANATLLLSKPTIVEQFVRFDLKLAISSDAIHSRRRATLRL